jgi:hypothetical protein
MRQVEGVTDGAVARPALLSEQGPAQTALGRGADDLQGYFLTHCPGNDLDHLRGIRRL